MINLHRVGIIARREYLATVRRREFVLVTLGLPIIYLLIALVAGIATASAVSSSDKKRNQNLPRIVGFYDASGSLAPAVLEKGGDNLTGRVYATLADGQAAVKQKQIRALLAVAPDFARSGQVRVYEPHRDSSFFDDTPGRGLTSAQETIIRRAQLAGHTDEATVAAVLRPVKATRQTLDPKTGRFVAPNPFESLAKFAVPYAFSLLLMLSVTFSSGYLLHGVVEEKENRVIEVLLSAATHEELLGGKIIGLGGAGMTQFGLWVGSALLVGGFARTLLPPAASSALAVPPGVWATALLLFLFGYAFYAALMAGLGSMGTSWRESQQLAGIVSSILAIPLVFIPVLLEDPNGTIARVLSLLPPTAPIGMMLRVAAGGGTTWEVALALALLAAATVGVLYLSARLFRLALLSYGQRTTLKQVIWYLRAPQ